MTEDGGWTAKQWGHGGNYFASTVNNVFMSRRAFLHAPANATSDTAAHGASFVLWDNLWGTNYVMWWPFTWPPPPEYASSAAYFPERSNGHTKARFTITRRRYARGRSEQR